jgi:hypothetical protein
MMKMIPKGTRVRIIRVGKFCSKGSPDSKKECCAEFLNNIGIVHGPEEGSGIYVNRFNGVAPNKGCSAFSEEDLEMLPLQDLTLDEVIQWVIEDLK